MPQPADVTVSAEALAALYAAVQRRLFDQWVTGHRPDTLAAVSAEAVVLDAALRRWLAVDLPAVYAAGGEHGAVAGGFEWGSEHAREMRRIVSGAYDDLLAATDHASATLKRAIRDQVATDTARAIAGDTTPQAAARDTVSAVMDETGAYTVTYSNEAKHSLADYADTALRTITANAYVQGTLNQSRADGVTFMQCADGAGCQLVTHDSGGYANGLVLSIDEAFNYPLAHPRCARDWFPRPDITTATQAEYATAPLAEREQAAAEEAARAEEHLVADQKPGYFSVERATARAERPPRMPRQPRTARAA